jgi:hypothetical protein
MSLQSTRYERHDKRRFILGAMLTNFYASEARFSLLRDALSGFSG